MPRKTIAAVVSSCLLAGCSTATFESARAQTAATTQQADRLKQVAQQPLPKSNMSPLQVHDRVYLATQAVKRQSGQILPAHLERDGVRLVAAGPLDIQAIGSLVTEATGLPVTFAADVFAVEAADGKPAPQTGNVAPAGGVSSEKISELAAALDGASARISSVMNQQQQGSDRMRVNYKGSLSGFLNMASAYFDLAWSYQDGRVQFARKVTRTFQLAAMPATVESQSDLNAGLTGSDDSGSGSGGSGSSGDSGSGDSAGLSAGASQTASVKVKLDFWGDLEKTLQTIVGTRGSFSASRSNSSVTVNAPASVVDAVGKQVRELNKQLLRQVTVRVEVYSVKLDEGSEWSLDLNGMYNVMDAKIGFGGSSGATSANAAGGFSAAITEKGLFRGSSATMNILDQQGDVSVVTSASVTTMSGQPVPLQVSNTRGYVSAIDSTSEEGVITNSMSTSTVNAGFSLNVLPKVMDDGKVLLQYSMNISTLVGKEDGFDLFEINSVGKDAKPGAGNKVQLPNVDQRSFIQQGLINNGATLVLAGYEKVDSNAKDTGKGSPNFKLLGGSRAGNKGREVLVIMITPVVLDHSADLSSYN
jgi:type IVB pilus formation R64 PilN family outer membrane protein